MTLFAVGLAYLVTLPVSVVVAWRLQRQHARESERTAAPGPGQESGPERIVRLGPGATPQRRDAS
jgi:hypothetical protein